jgi:hypothetical protein
MKKYLLICHLFRDQMIFSKSFILKIIIICSLIYLISIIIILSLINSRKCDSFESSQQFLNEIKTKNSNKITIILIEFEFFEHDLIQTLESICKLWFVYSVLIVSQRFIYPPIYGTIYDSISTKCNINFIRTEPQVQQMFNESRVETYINTEYVLIIPDSVRIDSQNIVYHLINSINTKPNERMALIIAVNNHSIDYNLNNNNCLQIDFDIKRWTLSYTKTHSIDSKECNAFEGSDYAVFVRKNDLLLLNQPFVRPFVESFFIQSFLHKFKLKLLKNLVINRGQELFATNARNKWKHKIWSEERRKLIYDMFGIKKMIDSKGVVHWFGCNKSTNRCFGTVVDDMPDYLYTNRWTPVCCLDNLAKTGRHVFSILEKFGVRYWLEGGSLLGAARNSEIIPWDYDIDIGVYKEDIEKLYFLSENSSVVDEKGFVWEKAKEGDFYRVQFSSTNRLHVDIFPFYSRNGTMTKQTWFESHVQDKEFPEHFLKPLTKIRFIEWDAFAPNNIVEFLEFKFGKNVINNAQYPKPHLLKFPNKSDIS